MLGVLTLSFFKTAACPSVRATHLARMFSERNRSRHCQQPRQHTQSFLCPRTEPEVNRIPMHLGPCTRTGIKSQSFTVRFLLLDCFAPTR
ncbi:hypothetical protein EDC04DRAFT_2738121 [Pisolithus marmoratus]|nr:hypothetical protein EDC04DRAFT_2737539 [Pisolithus marmoratus]KAI6020494.1 hypothetical protein EDC04DRAFT_2737679 [Pisolithus marmoratus]KAI6020520.1 hypothetical protein EDC04DRAFT_2738121 [Pisolithus marmoratus]